LGVRQALAVALIALVCWPQSANGWGNEGHMFVNRVAAQKLPHSMPPFLRAAADRLSYLGPEPDRWREKLEPELKNAQEPDHYIDLEKVEGMEFPPTRYEFIQALYARRAAAGDNKDDFLPEKVGLQPYITMEVYGRLKVAFREYRRLKAANQSTKAAEQNAIFYAGWLGHYVADAANPLHTTIHYDGWIGDNPKHYRTEKGLHYQFEAAFVARNIQPQQFAGMVHTPSQLSNPFADYVHYLRDSHAQLDTVYELDKVKAFEGAGSPEALRFVRQRLAAGTQMLVNLWYTAWMESATPAPEWKPPPEEKKKAQQ
jgi:hypothetical protein